jgi:hypothetical protein
MPSPSVHILKCSQKLSDCVSHYSTQHMDFSELLEKAELAYHDGLGAGSIVYLRKILEQVTTQAAEDAKISTRTINGGRKSFKVLLKEVDEHCSIIPKEFSSNGYRLFGELSDVVHGEYDEQLGLQKYKALYRLVIGIIDNVSENKEIMFAKGFLGWNDDNGGIS